MERKLVERCLAGEEAARGELVDQFGGQVFGLCFRMLGHRQDAEDVAQESLLRALRSLKNWDCERDFLPWLLAIAGNRCRTWLSFRARRPQTTTLGRYDVNDPRAADDSAVLAEEVQRALGGLRPEYRQAFLLFHEQQLNYQQISEALDCPLGTVKTWVHRARRDIVAQLSRRGVLEESCHAVRRV